MPIEILPIKEEYEKVELTGDLQYRLFINTKIFQDRETFLDCKDWLEEHIGEVWKDWAWPTARMPNDPKDTERWIMMLFKNEEDALRFKLVWG